MCELYRLSVLTDMFFLTESLFILIPLVKKTPVAHQMTSFNRPLKFISTHNTAHHQHEGHREGTSWSDWEERDPSLDYSLI